MGGVFAVQSTIMLLVNLAILAVTIFASVASLMYSAEAYRAAGKWSKQGWSIVLGLGVVLQFVPLGQLISIAMLIAALVFLADVRPALSSLTRRR